MTRSDNRIARLIEILMSLADIADERQETPFDREMGLGYRAFTGYIREGIKQMIDLKRDYYSARESKEFAKMELKNNEELLEKIFGRKDVEIYNDDEIARFKALADEIQKEIDEEVNADDT